MGNCITAADGSLEEMGCAPQDMKTCHLFDSSICITTTKLCAHAADAGRRFHTIKEKKVLMGVKLAAHLMIY
jgi:hypothetical protein